jgi:O-methyltransferase/aklanonic acid methyltransferase
MATADYKTEVARAFQAAADRYDGGEVSFFSPMGRLLVERAGPGRGDRVLDIGCGRGACVFAAAEAVGPAGTVVGIDIAPAMIEWVTSEARALNLRQVSATVMDAEYPDFADCSFDVMVGSFSVIYLADGPAVLRRYAPLLAPGGRFACTIPVFDDEHIPFLPHLFTEIITDAVLDEVPPQWRPRQFHERLTGWLADPGVIVARLADAGFESASISAEHLPMVTRSGADWVAWSRTHGMRLLWERLGEASRARLEKNIIDRLDSLRDADGLITLDLPVRFVVARKPGSLT